MDKINIYVINSLLKASCLTAQACSFLVACCRLFFGIVKFYLSRLLFFFVVLIGLISAAKFYFKLQPNIPKTNSLKANEIQIRV